MTDTVPRPGTLPANAREASGQMLAGMFRSMITEMASVPARPWSVLTDTDREYWQELGETLVSATLIEVDPKLLRRTHTLTCDEDSWALDHPLWCRPNLQACPVHQTLIADETSTDDLPDGEVSVRIAECGHLVAIDTACKRHNCEGGN